MKTRRLTTLLAIALGWLSLQSMSSADTPAEYAQRFKKNLPLAKAGDAEAQRLVGRAYDSGRGVEEDDAEAVAWYRKAAAQGDEYAILYMGYKFQEGEGVEKDLAEAVKWFHKALSSYKTSSTAGANLVRLSREELIKETYVGAYVEGGCVITLVDISIPIEEALANLAQNPKQIETGKGWAIGFNPQMLALAARGEEVIPALTDFIRKEKNTEAGRAGLLALYLVGMEGAHATGRRDQFKNRKAREAFWEILPIEGLTDEVSSLLKLDPWPADVPAIMKALDTVQGGCPATLNALLAYPLPKRPIDNVKRSIQPAGIYCRFTIPKSYDDRDYLRLAIAGIRETMGEDQVFVEEGVYEQISVFGRSGHYQPTKRELPLFDLLKELKDLGDPRDNMGNGRFIYYSFEKPPAPLKGSHLLHFHTASTAKEKWLEWWHESGEQQYVYSE